MAGGIELAPLVTKIKVDIASFKSDMGKAAAEGVRAAKDMENKMSNTAKLGETMSNIGAALTKKVTVPLVGAGVACSKFYLDAETSFSKVSTIIDTNVISMDKVKNKVIEASNETGVAITDFNEALYQSVSAGVESSRAIDFTTQMVQLARGGFTTTSAAVDVVTTALNAYGMSADQATAVSDKLITTQNLGKTTVDELASSMGKIIPTANAYNVNLDQLCTGMATLTSNGIQTAEATTYFNSMLNELGKAGTKASDVLKEKTGKSFAELQAEGASLTDVLAILKEEAENNGVALGDMFGSAEAGKAALSLMSDEGVKFNDILVKMEGSAGATQNAFDKMNADPAQQLATAMNELKNAGVQMGQALTPVILQVANGISGFAKAFQKLSPETKEFIAKTAMAAAAMGPLLSVTGKSITAYTKLVPAVKGVSKTIETLTGKKKLLSSAAKGAFNVLKAHPYALVATGAVALATGVYTVWKNLNKETIAAKESAKANSERIETIELQNQKTDYYAQKLEELSSKENKSAQDKQMIQAYVDRLNESVDGLNLAYDAEADKLNQTTDEIYKKIDAMKQEALQAAYIKQSKKALEDYAESQIKLTEAQERLEEVQKRYDEAAASGYVSQQMSTDLAQAKANVEDLTSATSTYWQEYVRQSNQAAMAGGQWDSLLKEAGKTAKQLPQTLIDGINSGKYAIPQTVEELNALIEFDEAVEKAGNAGKALTDALTQKITAGEADVSGAAGVISGAVSFKQAAQNAGIDGKGIVDTLARRIDSGKIDVATANQRINDLIEFSEAAEAAGAGGQDITAQLANQIKNGKLPVEDAIGLLTQSAAGKSGELGPIGADAGADYANDMSSSITANSPSVSTSLADALATAKQIGDSFDMSSVGAAADATIAGGMGGNQKTVTDKAGAVLAAGKAAASAVGWGGVGSGAMAGAAGGMNASPVTAKANSCLTSAKNNTRVSGWGSIGGGISSGMAAGVTSSALTRKIGSVIDSALSWAKRKLGINSPSRVFKAEIGEMISLGLAEGIEAEIPSVEKASALLADATIFEPHASDAFSTSAALQQTYTGRATLSAGKSITGDTAASLRTEAIIDYDKLAKIMIDALSGISIEHKSEINGRTLIRETLPLIDKGMGRKIALAERGV